MLDQLLSSSEGVEALGDAEPGEEDELLVVVELPARSYPEVVAPRRSETRGFVRDIYLSSTNLE